MADGKWVLVFVLCQNLYPLSVIPCCTFVVNQNRKNVDVINLFIDYYRHARFVSTFSFFFLFRVKVIECSAKDDINVREIFRNFLTLSRIFPKDADDPTGLKRRSSAYVSASKGGRRAASPALEKDRVGVASCADGGNVPEPRPKPRSRSLIRRASRKTKQQMRDVHNSVEDCTVS